MNFQYNDNVDDATETISYGYLNSNGELDLTFRIS